MLPITLFRLVFCLFWFNRNIETLCFGIEAKRFISDSAETSFGSHFSCFVLKLVSKDTLGYSTVLYTVDSVAGKGGAGLCWRPYTAGPLNSV